MLHEVSKNVNMQGSIWHTNWKKKKILLCCVLRHVTVPNDSYNLFISSAASVDKVGLNLGNKKLDVLGGSWEAPTPRDP